MAMFIALSAIGAMIKIPSPMGSVALDSFPALLAALVLGPAAGGAAAALGHLLSAMMSGMVYGPLHFLIMLEMGILVWMYGRLAVPGHKKSAAFLFLIGNSFILPLPFAAIISPAFYYTLLLPLTAATVINLLAALLIGPRLVPLLQKMLSGGKEQ